MKQIPIRLGPLALLLTVISICLTTLAILTFTTARADLRLAEKYAQTVQTRYALEKEGQAYLQQVSADPATLTEADGSGVVWKTLEKDGSRLEIGLMPDGADGCTVAAWKHSREWHEDTGIGNLWGGQ